jgi:HEAT repeats
VNESQDNTRKDRQAGAPDASRKPARALRCNEVESLAVLAACDELGAVEHAALDAHIARCSACAAVVEREARLQHMAASLDQPADSLDRSGLLLAQCRSQLAEALDDRQNSAERSMWPAFLSPANWWGGLRHTLIYHPATSMAVLLVAGFLAGVAGQRLRVEPPQAAAPGQPVMTASSGASAPSNAPAISGVSGAPRITDEQLRRADSAHVAWVSPSGSPTPTVQVELNAPTPLDIVGAPDDADVQRALRFLLENGQRFDPDVRLDSLDVLRINAADPDVRHTLCAAARLDPDPNVRLKALGALGGFERDPAVREALLDALESDANSGVRVQAIHQLLSALQSDGGSNAFSPQAAEILRDRLHNDPNPTVRRQSAAALRALGEQ